MTGHSPDVTAKARRTYIHETLPQGQMHIIESKTTPPKMNVNIDLPQDYTELKNDFYMMAKREQGELEYGLPALLGLNLSVRMVERHVIPFTSGTLVKSDLSPDGTALSVTMLMHRLVPATVLKDLFSSELKKLVAKYN